MKNFKFVLLASVFSLSASVFAAENAATDPACTAIVAACEGAGYQPNEHKKNNKGLWIDCIGAIAKGKTVAGVSNTKEEARACMKVHRQARKQKHK